MTYTAMKKNNTSSFLKIFRKLQDWQWYNDANTLATLIHCILRANTQKIEWKGVTLKRGQFITSRSELAKEVGISEREIRTALERLTKCQTIDLQTTNRYTIITILNYGKYQPSNNTPRPAKRQPNANKTTTVIEDIYVVVDNITREEFLEDFFSPQRQTVIQQLCLARGFGSIQNFRQLASDVLTEWESINCRHSDISEARKHLIAHCSRKIAAQQQNSTQNSKTQNHGSTNFNPSPSKTQRTQTFTAHILDKLRRPRQNDQHDLTID